MFASIRTILSFDNWPSLIAGRLFSRSTSLQVHRVAGMQMLVDHRGADAGSIRTCIGSPMYRQFLAKVKLPEKISVLDIGANVGGFTLLCQALGYTLNPCVCLELNPNTFERLRFNIKTNIGLDAKVENCAVWSHTKTLNLSLGFGNTSDRIEDNARCGNAQDYLIPAATLNHVIEKYFDSGNIDLCKIDIEGAESAILLGDHCQKIQQIRHLIIEIHHDRTYSQLIARLSQFGFNKVANLPGKKLGVHLFENTEGPYKPGL